MAQLRGASCLLNEIWSVVWQAQSGGGAERTTARPFELARLMFLKASPVDETPRKLAGIERKRFTSL